MKKTYKIEVDCANCANKMELAAGKVPGVRSAVVNFMMQKLIIEFEDGVPHQEIMGKVHIACKKAAPDCEVYL
jgi:copper chaperone CopZ